MSTFGSPFGLPTGRTFGNAIKRYNQQGAMYPTRNLLAYYKTTIADGKLIAYRPSTTSTVQQVKGSGFTGAGTGSCTGLLTTDTITSQGTAPTCSVAGTLTISADCWDIEVHRAGVLWAYWPGINITPLEDPPATWTELDASGNGHHLVLTTTTITERLDGTGTDYANEVGFTTSGANRVPAVLKDRRSSALINSIFPTSNISSTITKLAADWYNLDMIMSDGYAVGVKFANSTIYIDDIVLKRVVQSVNETAAVFTGSWTNGTSALAFGGTYKWSATTGAHVDFTSAAGATVLALHYVKSSNAGIALVAIDGDATLATGLSTANDLVVAGTLPDTVLVANGGTLNPTDRVLNHYSSGLSYSQKVILVDGLSPGVHTVTITNTGYKQAASTDDRVYVAGFASDAEIGTQTLIDVFSCMGATGSAFEMAASYTPTGISNQWYGTVHNNETLTSFKVYDNGVEQTLAINGTVTSTNLSIVRVSSLVHPTEGAVGESTMTYMPTSEGLSISQRQEFYLDGALILHQGMFPVLDVVNNGSSSSWGLDYALAAADNSLVGVAGEINDAYVWSDTAGVALRLYSDTPKEFRIEDRAEGVINKIYSCESEGFDADTIVANQVFESTSTWQIAHSTSFPLRDTLIGTSDAEGNAVEYPGPLNRSATVTEGTTLADAVITAPLGPKFQGISEWANNAAVDLATFSPTTRTRVGQKGVLIYSDDLTVTEQVRADKYLGLTEFQIDYMNYTDEGHYTNLDHYEG